MNAFCIFPEALRLTAKTVVSNISASCASFLDMSLDLDRHVDPVQWQNVINLHQTMINNQL